MVLPQILLVHLLLSSKEVNALFSLPCAWCFVSLQSWNHRVQMMMDENPKNYKVKWTFALKVCCLMCLLVTEIWVICGPALLNSFSVKTCSNWRWPTLKAEFEMQCEFGISSHWNMGHYFQTYVEHIYHMKEQRLQFFFIAKNHSTLNS